MDFSLLILINPIVRPLEHLKSLLLGDNAVFINTTHTNPCCLEQNVELSSQMALPTLLCSTGRSSNI